MYTLGDLRHELHFSLDIHPIQGSSFTLPPPECIVDTLFSYMPLQVCSGRRGCIGVVEKKQYVRAKMISTSISSVCKKAHIELKRVHILPYRVSICSDVTFQLCTEQISCLNNRSIYISSLEVPTAHDFSITSRHISSGGCVIIHKVTPLAISLCLVLYYSYQRGHQDEYKLYLVRVDTIALCNVTNVRSWFIQPVIGLQHLREICVSVYTYIYLYDLPTRRIVPPAGSST
jgi:hypothetical protein